jgi:tight adherence protein B
MNDGGAGGSAALLGALLAGLSAAAFVLALFYPVMFRAPLASRRSAVFEALLKGPSSNHGAAATRLARRAQETALKSLAQHGKASRPSPIESQLAAAGLDWPAGRYLAVSLAFAAALFGLMLLAGRAPAAALGAACLAAWFLPQRYLAMRAERRKLAFLTAFSAAVDMIVRGAKAGLAVADCFAVVAADAAEPVKSEFEAILAQLKAGVPLPAALDKLAAAMPAPEVRFFTLIMSMQSQTGGNLTDALANLSGVLKDREKIASKVRIASAEARASALIIGLLPFAVIAGTAAVAPSYITVFWADEAGRRIAVFCIVWLVAGAIVLRRMARIEV